ncbi:MAG: hypothetical protein ACQEW8_06160 [Actinomycetota bacterium]
MILWVALGAIVLGAVGAIIAFALMNGDGGDAAPSASPTPTVTATPAPAADPTETGELDEESAVDAIETALAAPFATVGTSDDLAELLKNVAVDAYAAELEAQWQELISQGWTIDGSPSLVSAEVTDLDADADTPTASVTACVDSSEVTISDAAGDQIGDPAATEPRALHLFTLIQGSDDVWRISAHGFPNDPTC